MQGQQLGGKRFGGDDTGLLRRLRLVDQAVVYGVEGKFETVGNSQFMEDIVQVVLHRLFADELLFANLAVSETLRHELNNFLLALAEQRLFPPLSRFGRFLEGVDYLGGHAIIEPDFAVMDLADALQKQIAGGLLQQHAARSQTHRAHHIAVVFRRRQDDHAGRKSVEIHLFEYAQTILLRHAQIEQENVRLQLSEHLRTLDAVGGLAHDLDVVRHFEQLAETVAENRVVVRDQYSNCWFCFRHN